MFLRLLSVLNMIEKNRVYVYFLMILFALFFYLAFYPGFMSADSISQLAMSKTFRFSDWHPPVMSWVWAVTGVFLPGPSGMLVLQLVMLWGAVYLWWNNYRERPVAWIIFAVPFLPWIFNFSGVIWKDVELAFSLLLLSGLALRSPTLFNFLLAFVLVFYSVNLRHNAIFAVMPILFLLCYMWLRSRSWGKALVISSFTVILCVFLGWIFSYKVLKAEKMSPSSYMMVDDLSYLSIKSNKSFLPGVSIDEIKECALLEIGNNRLVGRTFCLPPLFFEPRGDISGGGLKKIWLEQIIKNPLEYVKFRFAAFSYLLRNPTGDPYYIWHPGVDENELGIEYDPGHIALFAEDFVKGAAAYFPFFFKPYWWLLLSLLLLPLTFLFSDSRTVYTARFMLLSAACYIIGYFPVTPMADFRYVYWSVIAVSMSAVILLVDRPSFIPGLSVRRLFFVSFFAISASLIVFNHGSFSKLNLDDVLYEGIVGQRVSVGAPQMKSDLIETGADYEVVGLDPAVVYDVSSLKLASQDSLWLKFDFTCSGLKSVPELQIFWWGGLQSGPSEEQSIIREGSGGVNLLPLHKYIISSNISLLRAIRIDLVDASSCEKISLSAVEFIK